MEENGAKFAQPKMTGKGVGGGVMSAWRREEVREGRKWIGDVGN